MKASKRAVERQRRGLPEPQTCSAHKKDGSPCGRWPVKGATVCPKHGGAAPQVQRKARERLAAAADILMAQLLKIAASAESEAVRLAAVRDALDRAGFGAAQMHKLSLAQPWDDLLADIITDDIFEPAIPALPRALPAGRGGGVAIEDDDEDYTARGAVQSVDADEPRVAPFLTPTTIRGEVVPERPEPSTEQADGYGRTSRRARAAFRESMGDGTDRRELERSEYSDERQQASAADDASMPPAYVREALESEGLDWRTGERLRVQWTG